MKKMTTSVWKIISAVLEMSCMLCCVWSKPVIGLANIVLCHSLLCWIMWSLAELLGENDSDNQLSSQRAFLCSHKSVASFCQTLLKSVTNYWWLLAVLSLAFWTLMAISKHKFCFLNSCRARQVCVFSVWGLIWVWLVAVVFSWKSLYESFLSIVFFGIKIFSAAVS